MIRVGSAVLLAFGLVAFSVSASAQSGAPVSPAASAAPQAAPQAAAAAPVNCAQCHGPDGNALGPTFPKLAGQHEGYLYKQLTNFKPKSAGAQPERVNPIMNPIAASLSDDDMHRWAKFFSTQKLVPDAAKNKDTLDAGMKIWRGGVATKGVPACAGCHGPAGAGIPVQYPRLAGQWGDYIEAQLVAFRQGTRANNPAMTAIASRLSDAEIKAVSDYAAGLR